MTEDESASPDVDTDRLPKVGEEIVTSKGTFILAAVIGVGGYGCVYRVRCRSSARLLALKAELFSKSVITNEIVVLKAAAMNNCRHVCELVDYGRVGKQFMYIVMTLLGEDLYRLRRYRESECFSLGTTLRAAQQTLKAIEELHECGFVSRDIKPSNFATGNAAECLTQHIYMFDFGLAKRHTKNTERLVSRGIVGWRGTARYGSLNAHNKQDLSRRDDLESWLYMIVEFANGSLPWRFVHDRDEVGMLKEDARGLLRDSLFANCPAPFDDFLTQIDLLDFDSIPQYEDFYSALEEALRACSMPSDAPYDWETSSSMKSTSMPDEAFSSDESTQSGNVTTSEDEEGSYHSHFAARRSPARRH